MLLQRVRKNRIATLRLCFARNDNCNLLSALIITDGAIILGFWLK